VYRDGKPVTRKEGNGILNKGVLGTITQEESLLVHAKVWDLIPLSVVRGESTGGGTYIERLNNLRRYVMGYNLRVAQSKISIAETLEVYDIDQTNNLFQKYLSAGKEGIILKNVDSLWENKRVKHQIKFKAELNTDLLCVGWVEGTGKYVGMMGALNLQSSDGIVTVDVGTGFTDLERKTITPENIIGKIIEIKYNERISDKRTLKESLFLPVFLNIREDKNVADTSSTIK
jgi:hypothetical protein